MAYIVTTSKENESTKNEQLVQKEYKNCPKNLRQCLLDLGESINKALDMWKSLDKSTASLLLGNFGIGMGVHPSRLQIKKNIDAKVWHLLYKYEIGLIFI